MSSAPSLPPRLVALSPGNLARATIPGFLAATTRAHAAGLAGLVLREPGLDERTYVELAGRLRTLFAPPTGRGRAWLALHDRAHLAAALGTEAVHVGFRSLAPEVLRTWLDPRIAIGLSTHAHDDERAWTAADYLFHGPVFDTPSKRGRVEPIGLAGLVRAKARTTLPVWALGGIQVERVRDVLATGVQGVAVRAAIFDATDPGVATERLLGVLATWEPTAPAG